MENSSPFSATHHHPFSFDDDDNDDIILRVIPPPPFPDQFFHQSTGGALHAPGGSSTSMLYTNSRPSGQYPHFISGGGHEDNNYNNLPDQSPSSTTFQPGQHVEPVVITADLIEDYSHLFDQVDQDGLYSSNIDFDFSLDNQFDFDATSQTQDINHNEALLHGGGVASQLYHEETTITSTQSRKYKRWPHEEMSKLLDAIYESRQSRFLWEDVKNNHFCDTERSKNTLKQKFKEMCKAAATSSGVKDPKTKELYDLALMLRGEIQQKKGFKK